MSVWAPCCSAASPINDSQTVTQNIKKSPGDAFLEFKIYRVHDGSSLPLHFASRVNGSTLSSRG